MKPILILFFYLVTVVSVYAQSDLQIVHTEKVIGKNIKTNTNIRAIEYVFPGRIRYSYVQPVSNLLTIQLQGGSENGKYLKNVGDVILYDLTDNKLKWSQKMNYLQDFVEQDGDIIIRTSLNKSTCLYPEDGDNKWDVRNRIYFVDANQKIGIGYKSNTLSGEQSILQGINLESGDVLWNKELNCLYEGNSIFKLNDSVVIVNVRGLHAINLKDGKGWDYNAATTTVKLNGLIRELTSNILVDSADIFYASQTQITRLGHNGKIKWIQPLPKELTSKSSIFIKNNFLYLVNSGFGIIGAKQVSCGKPFLASFDLKTGRQNFLTEIEGKKQQINGFKVNQDTVLLVFKDKIIKCSLLNGSLISEKLFEVDSMKELKTFLGGLFYAKADSTFKSLESIDSTKNYIWNETGRLFKLNEKLEVMNEIDSKQLYYCYLQTRDFRFIAKKNETIVIDKAGKIVAQFQASIEALLLGTKLYDVRNNNFIIIELEELLMKQFQS